MTGQLYNDTAAGLSISVVSNNCSNPALTWAGEAADLAVAAAAIAAAGRSGPVLAISCSLLLLPEHNVSRIIEHALLRNTSVCCFSRLSATDLQLDAGAGPGAAAPGSKSSNGSSRASSTSYGRMLIAADVPAPPLDAIEVRAPPHQAVVLQRCYSLAPNHTAGSPVAVMPVLCLADYSPFASIYNQQLAAAVAGGAGQQLPARRCHCEAHAAAHQHR
jgi:hypothetical protein